MKKPKTYFTADWHLFHANIIRYCNRPFRDTAEMNQTILDRLNDRVEEDDWLYFLGDMAFIRDVGHLHYWLDQLRCRNICVIKGNHDRSTALVRDRFYWFKDYAEITVENQSIVLMHYAMRVWNKAHHGAWQLYGHSHGSLPEDPKALSMDVGVDTNNYYPYSFDEISERMRKKRFVSVDHHQ